MDNVYFDYQAILIDIGEHLDDRQLKNLLHFASDKITSRQTRTKILENRDFLEAYEILMERDVVKPASNESPGDSTYLINILQRIQRDDLANKLITFHEQLSGVPKSSIPQSSSSCSSFEVLQSPSCPDLASLAIASNYESLDSSNCLKEPQASDISLINRYLDDMLEDDGAQESERPNLKSKEEILEERIEEMKMRLFNPFVVKSKIVQDLSECADFNPNEYSNESTYLSDEQIKALQLGTDPRKYQVELANLSLHGHNSIVCLRTGGGKTLVAALIVKYLHVLHKYKLKKRFKTIFIVPTRLLIEQQLAFFKKVFGPDNFDLKGLVDDELLGDYITPVDVVFCTPQKVVNCLKTSKIGFQLTSVDLIVFDECHHSIKNHPYNDIMKSYHKQSIVSPELKLPRIIGLTASIGCGDSKKAFEQLVYLCANLDCIHLAFVQANVSSLAESMPTTNSYRLYAFDKPNPDMFALGIESIIRSIEMLTDIKPRQQYGSKVYMQQISEINQRNKKIGQRERVIAGEFILLFNSELLNYNDLAFEQVFKSLVDQMNEKRLVNPVEIEKFIYELFDTQILAVFSNSSFDELRKKGLVNDYNQKLQKLIEIIRDHLEKDKTAIGLVFVPTRNNAIAIQAFIKSQISEDLVQSTYLMGKAKNANQISDENMSDTQQKTVLDKFRRREFNLLVVTSVAAEGIDIPDCNYVIRFDFVSDEINFIQIRGRARCENSYYHVITYHNSVLLNNEKKNEILEREMDEALKVRQRIGSEEFEKLVAERKERICAEIGQNESVQQVQSAAKQNEGSGITYEVFCAKCNHHLFDSTSLRKRVVNYLTIDEAFIQSKIVTNECSVKEFKTEKHVARLLCKNEACGNSLGKKLEYKVGSLRNGFALKVTALKFREKNALENAEYILFKKWKDVNFAIEEIPLQ